MKAWFLILMLSLGIGLSAGVSVYAEEGTPEGGIGQAGMGQGGPGNGNGKGKMMGMGMMQRDSVVATSDGGVVLMQGPRLIKYDKDLNLVKEVEIPRGKKPPHDENQNQEASGESANLPVQN